MIKAKKVFSLLLSATLVSAAFLGCENKAANTDTDKVSSSKEIKADIKILWPGTTEAEKKVAQDLQDKVKKDYPGINIQYIFLNWSDIEKKLAIMVQGGDSPDLMMIQDITNPVAMGALETLDQYLNANINKDKFIKATWEVMQKDSNTYAIPALAIIYSHVANTELLDKAGFKVNDLKTWDDLIKASNAIKSTGKNGYAMANGGEGRFTFRDFMMVCLSNGITPDQVDDAHKKQYIEVLNLFNTLGKDMPTKSQVTWMYPELFKAWEAGDVGFMHTGSYFTANVIAHGNKAMDRTAPFAFPAGPSASKPQIMVGSVGMAMIKSSKNKEAAWKVIEEIMSPEILGQWGGAINITSGNYVDKAIIESSAKNAFPQVYKQHMALCDQWTEIANQYGVPIPSILGQKQMEITVQGVMVKMLSGEISPEQAYDQIRTGIQQVKEKYK